MHIFWVSVSADPAGFICNNLAVLLTRARDGSEPQLCGHGITRRTQRVKKLLLAVGECMSPAELSSEEP